MKFANTVKGSIALAIGLWVYGCSSEPIYTGDADSRWADFKRWTKVTDAAPTSGDPVGFIGNIHKGREGYRDVYVNDVGVKAINGSAPYRYPIGTVIVKEQFDSLAAFKAQQPTELAIMVKLKETAKPDETNWGWASGYEGKVQANEFCSSCHSAVEKNDFVFTNADFLQSLQ